MLKKYWLWMLVCVIFLFSAASVSATTTIYPKQLVTNNSLTGTIYVYTETNETVYTNTTQVGGPDDTENAMIWTEPPNNHTGISYIEYEGYTASGGALQVDLTFQDNTTTTKTSTGFTGVWTTYNFTIEEYTKYKPIKNISFTTLGIPGYVTYIRNVTIEGNNVTTGTTTNLTGELNLKFVNASHITKTTTAILTSGDYNLTGIYDSILNVSAYANPWNETITNFSVLLQQNNYNYSYTYNTTTGNIEIPLIQGLEFIGVGVNTSEIIFDDTSEINATPSTSYEEENIYFYNINTILFNLKDEITKATITSVNVTMNLISDLISYTYSTTNGTIYAPLLEPTTYNVRTTAAGYVDRFYSALTVTNGSYQDITIYMLNESLADNITITVIDQNTLVLENATVKALKYDPSTNTYITVEVGNTNFEGEVYLSLQKNTEYYKFIIEYNNEVIFTSNPSYIYKDSLAFQVNTAGNILQNYDYFNKISSSISFDNTTNEFTFIFTDSTSQSHTYCLDIDKYNGLTTTTINTTCTTTTAGSITLSFTPVNESVYTATGYYTEEGIDYELSKKTISFKTILDLGTDGLFLQLILTLIFIIGTVALHPVFVPISISLSLIIGRLMFLNPFDMGILLGFMAVGIIITYVIGRDN
jgi:hypothetical protein